MATKTRAGLGVMHAAGIYSDMTVDGPEIGTLVVIVDRAKNLPNRKSMGKQDPYCAARLGKDAKKTDTDKRGGQTPRWDQELRFTVHDSPDYYQLKVSVFNDDKKTDLVGETWIGLQGVVMPGGGQSDTWHNLQYRGKYAGEIRIEITYYDSRAKPEKAADKVKQSASATADSSRDSSTGSLSGPRQPKAAVKRRPLPSDPTNASPSPAATPDHVQTPPRGFQTPEKFVPTQSPLQAIEYNTNIPQHSSESRQHGSQYSDSRYSEPHHHHQPHVSSHGSQSHSTQSHGPALGMVAYAPAPQPIQGDRYEIYDPQQGNEYVPGNILGRHDELVTYERNSPSMPQEQQRDMYDTHSFSEFNGPPSPGGPPPPPPAHRSQHISPPAPMMPTHNSYDSPHQNSRINTVRLDHHRNSMPEYSQPKSYEAYSPSKEYENQSNYTASNDYQDLPSRHNSYDDRMSIPQTSMQAYVEDAPSSPLPFNNYMPQAQHYDNRSQYDDRGYDKVPSPAPLNLSGRNSALSGYQNAGPSHSSSYNSHHSNGSPLSYREQSHMSSDISSRTSHSHQSQASQYSQPSVPSQPSQYSHQGRPRSYTQQSSHYRQIEESASSPIGYMPALPSTLVAGMDPVISREISDRIYSDTRNSHNSHTAMVSRGQYQEQPQQRQQYSHSYSRSDAPVVSLANTSSHDINRSSMSNGTYTPVTKPRPISPNPTPGSIPRKSVSPSPMHMEQRRLSGVPFGPDAFDVLNPNVTPTKPAESYNSSYNKAPEVPDPEAKIIMHDGREVDPSDHLPEHSWAPEPEARGPKKTPEAARSRPSPAGAQPMPSSTRRPPRGAHSSSRPQSVVMTPSHSSPYMSGGAVDDSPVAAHTRNRLQKKSNRQPGNTPAGTSPLAPISPYQDNGFVPRGLPRAHTIDFAGENGYSSGSPNSYRGGGSGPPVPAKVPIQNYGPPPPAPEENAWALLEEMKSIDLGHGKARRKRFG